MDVFNLNPMINHCMRKMILSGNDLYISKDILLYHNIMYITTRNLFFYKQAVLVA